MKTPQLDRVFVHSPVNIVWNKKEIYVSKCVFKIINDQRKRKKERKQQARKKREREREGAGRMDGMKRGGGMRDIQRIHPKDDNEHNAEEIETE